MRYEFVGVLNDLVDYFLVGDVLLLQRYKEENCLADDLASEFVSGDSADKAVRDGIVIPLAGIENYPYTVIFSLSGDVPELFKPESRLQHWRGGYVMRVENRSVLLFTWRILQNFTRPAVGTLLDRYRSQGRPMIEIENGFYDVEVLGGEVLREGSYEPAFEFVVTKKAENGCVASQTDINYRFSIDSRTY